MQQGRQEDVGAVCEVCGRQPGAGSFPDLPPDTIADLAIKKKLEAKALDPYRRQRFHDVFLKTHEGRALFAGLLFDLGLFQEHLPTARAVAMRDVAAHLLFSTGLTINEEWILAWLNNMTNPVVMANLDQIQQTQAEQHQPQMTGAQPAPGFAGMAPYQQR